MGKEIKLTETEKKSIKVLAGQNYTAPEIARKIGRSKMTVYAHLKKENIRYKTNSQASKKDKFLQVSAECKGDIAAISDKLGVTLQHTYYLRKKHGLDQSKEEISLVKPSDIKKGSEFENATKKKSDIKPVLQQHEYYGAACDGCYYRRHDARCTYGAVRRGYGKSPEEPKCEHNWEERKRKIYKA